MTPIPGFAAFFQSLWGYEYEPFPWQMMLADRIATGRWPRAIDLPTAAGKTACIDAAIYALATQAEKPLAERTAPRRIWFVVDRRIVVDEAFDRAKTIAEKLQEAKNGPLKAIADRLCRLSGTERPLAVARLRGGVLRDDNWGRLPSQPAVITSTVDQLGSRVLFRGYGRSNLTASIYAGLAANDSLVLLDEAHCSVPFTQTLRAIETFRGEAWAEAPIVTPFAFAILSATPPADIPKDDVFPGRDRERALDHPILRKRLSASKPATLVRVDRARDGDSLIARAAREALSYRAEAKRRVAVIVNRVHTARMVASELRGKVGDSTDVVLLTGRIRPYERDRLVETWKPFLRANAPAEPNKPIILVSTQCIEVGADFSFDALITEAASLDALRQRFGRLNRMGESGDALATILLRNGDAKEGQVDPIYGSAVGACWALLTDKATEGHDGSKNIDFGFEALDSALSDVDDLSPCLAPRPNAPILLPAYLDLLCQTAPAPAVEPDIGLFLHGKERGTPEARVIWRADLAPSEAGVWKETIALCPPASGEMLTVPLHRLRAWLETKVTGDEGTSDVEGSTPPTEDEGDSEGGSRPFLRWRGRDCLDVCDRPQEIKPNDIVVVPAAYKIGDLGQFELHEAFGVDRLDLWEAARRKSGKPAAMRISGATLEPWRKCPPFADLIAIAEDPARGQESVREALDAVIAYRPSVEEELQISPPPWLQDLVKEVRDGRIEEHPAGGIVLFTNQDRRDAEPDLFADDDDFMSAIVAEKGDAVSLARHTQSAECAVGQIANRCLPQRFRDPLVRSARWHDVGKLDERFQHLLRQGADVSGEPLAKSTSMPSSPARRRALRAEANLPEGFRHEMLSLQLAERCAGLGHDEKDLVLHLVASHHGYARPFAPVVSDLEPPAVSGNHAGVAIALDAADRIVSLRPHDIASGVADRFWRLTRRYGWWGLAYLEAALRLGDWYGSVVLVDDGPAQDAPPARVAVVSAERAANPIALTGIDGANPLGFLAAVGALAVLQRDAPQARLGWRREVTWRPVLTNVPDKNRDALCDVLATALCGRRVNDNAESKRKVAEQAFAAAKKAVKDERDEIKTRGIRGKERKAAFDREIGPLEREMQRKRTEWLHALRDAVPSRELALGQRIDCTDEEFRDHAAGFFQGAHFDARGPLDFLAAFASDACVDKSGRVLFTPFCFITGSGHQYFLDTVRQLMGVVSTERVRAVLFEPWTYSDEKLSMRWDPTEDRRYALMDRDPTASDNKSRTVWMANLLAYRALSLFPSAPGRLGLETAGWSGSDELFSWPIWEHPVATDTIRSLIQSTDLRAERPDRHALRVRGIVGAFRARRVKVGSGANYKINFSPARSA